EKVGVEEEDHDQPALVDQRPTLAHQITVEFVNALPDGTVLADTRVPSEGVPAGPVTVRLSEIAFPGLREALQLMPAGARWEVVVPGSQAYGDDIDQVRELAGQALVFNIKLVSVGGIVPPPGG
ncbi:MAG: FKBP-type peptidyl-prolyl cis-trans isomerase, partial [Pseudoxanthomonas sp.]|nr:FKBP-type peptidyl-prolyl cis-trans isomerase [Pseudoxanthomonas sp.]